MSTGPRCSAVSAAVSEPMAGSAPRAAAWLALEQPGPWGARALTESHLDAGLGRALDTAAATAGVRAALIRRPGRHPDTHPASRRVLVAHTAPGRVWLLSGQVDDPAALLGVDLAAAARGDADAVRRSLPVLSPVDEQHLLVCTNGTRDLCCASLGRPVVQEVAAARPGVVWETSHTSGHRFAPTAVLLPHGTLHGRLDPSRAMALLDAARDGRTVLDGHRGRSTWPPEGQVAELAVREDAGELALDALTVRPGAPGSWLVRHRDGREWRVGVATVETPVERPESCGKPALPLRRYAVTGLTPR